MRILTIKPVLNGWLVEVDQQNLVYTNSKDLIKDLEEYLADPEKKEKEVDKKAINPVKRITGK